ncbi:hypothetical protein [Streptomyces sp. NPDC047024]|uniref:hypothetical protein n=1 Tax=Streptomyces sp. NPDC047024 TaxID=3155476 RepID=UPI0033E74B1A
MTEATLKKPGTRSCWTLAEGLGHRGPRLLSRTAVDPYCRRSRTGSPYGESVNSPIRARC